MSLSPFNLKDKCIWVAGGAGYLGQSVVKALHASGAKVLCIDLAERATAFVAREKPGDTVEAITFDLNNTELIPSFVREQTSLYGRPDGLVNLSFGSTAKTLETLTAQDFDGVNHTGITATFILAREIVPYMGEKGGSIVLFSSMYGIVSPDGAIYEAPMNKNPIEYGVGKAGIIQMTRYMAVHWARQNVRCNCISPGPFPNPDVQQQYPDFIERLKEKSPMGRIGIAHEISGPVLFLLSEASAYITGHNLVVDGGWTAW